MSPKTLAASVVAGLSALALAACSAGTGPATGTGNSAGSTQAAAAAKTLRLSLNQTEQHPSFIALKHFGERLSTATNGRLGIQVYPNETLGAQAEALQLVGDGSVDLAIVSGSQLEKLNQDFSVFNLPLVFDSVESQMKVVNNLDVVGDLYKSLESSNQITVVGGFTQGTRSVYTSKGPVNTPADLKGQKIRVQDSPLAIAMVDAMGASATPMAFGEVYTALQSGVIDGAENNEVSYVTQKHLEVAKYFSRTNHLVGLDYLIINSGLLNGLSAEDRAAFDKEWAATFAEHTQLWAAETDKAVKTAEAAGAKFNEVDTAAFRAALEPLTAQYLKTDTQKALYQAAQSAAK